MSIIRATWNSPVEGTPMFILVSKLKVVKKALAGWHRSKPRLQVQIDKARDNLDEAQRQFDAHESSTNQQTLLCAKSKLEKCLDYELSLLQQRSRILNLNLKDIGSKFFYNSIKVHQTCSNIKSIRCSDGSITDDPFAISSSFVAYFTQLLSNRVDQFHNGQTNAYYKFSVV